jgi:hypothetical protein
MLIKLQNYLDDYNFDNVPVPDWTHLDVLSKETICLSWDEIYIDHELNDSKVEEHTPEEIQNLRLSFAEGVSPAEFPPAVVYRGKEFAKPYKLVYGFGRSEALRELKTKRWVFTLLEGSEDGIEDVQAAENEGYYKRFNAEVDMRKFLIGKVNTGKIAKTEAAIRAKFRKVYPNRKKEVENRVVPQVSNQLGVPQPYILYTSSAKVQDWLSNNSRENYCTDGDFDKSRDMYGVQMKEGYQYRAVLNAIKKYVETGKKTYVIYHCGAPSKTATLIQKRKKVVGQFEEMRKNLESIGLNVWPVVYMGALPQDRENDSLKELVVVK